MTSKDKLDTIRWRYVSAMFPNKPDEETMLYIEEIEKDLEMLELIKALFKWDTKLGNKVCTGKILYDGGFVVFTSKDTYDKIEEWLNDTRETNSK